MFRVILSLMGAVFRIPREIFRSRVILPLAKLVDDTFDVFQSKAKAGLYTTKDVVLRGSVIAFIVSLLVCLSVFMYLAFYFTYVPAVAHEKSVHLTFQADSGEKPHDYLYAHVELTKHQQLLMLGQPYQIYLDLEVPESPANKNMGMFMVCATFKGKNGDLITRSCRSCMLHYRSPLMDFIYTLFYSPMFVFGFREESQHLHIEMFANYEEQQGPTVTDVYIEVQSKEIELYSARFLINAKFSGLRYFMFNWPLLSAALGISSNIFFIAIIGIISWYQLIHSEEYRRYIEERQMQMSGKSADSQEAEDSYSSSSIEDISMMERPGDKSDSDGVEDVSGDMPPM